MVSNHFWVATIRDEEEEEEEEEEDDAAEELSRLMGTPTAAARNTRIERNVCEIMVKPNYYVCARCFLSTYRPVQVLRVRDS
jgi:hypothetical protein